MQDNNKTAIANPNSIKTKNNGLVFDNNDIKSQLEMGFKRFHAPSWAGGIDEFNGSRVLEQNMDIAWLVVMTKYNKTIGINTQLDFISSDPLDYLPIPFNGSKVNETSQKVSYFDKLTPLAYKKILVAYHNIKASLDLEYQVQLYKNAGITASPKQISDYRNLRSKNFQLWNIDGFGNIVDNANKKVKISRNDIERDKVTDLMPFKRPGTNLVYEYKTNYGGRDIIKKGVLNVDITNKDFHNFNPFKPQGQAIGAYTRGLKTALDAGKNISTGLSNQNTLVWGTDTLPVHISKELAILAAGFRTLIKDNHAVGIGNAIALFGNKWFANLPDYEKVFVIKAVALFQYNKGNSMSMDGMFSGQNSGKDYDRLNPLFDMTGKERNRVLDYYLIMHNPEFIEKKLNVMKLTSIWNPLFQFSEKIKREGSTKDIDNLTRGHVTTLDGKYQTLSLAELAAYTPYAKARNIKLFSPNDPAVKYKGISNLVPVNKQTSAAKKPKKQLKSTRK